MTAQEKIKARSAVQIALKNGTLIKFPCFCGDPNSEAHHEDYSKPLVVVWLCRKHHNKREGKVSLPMTRLDLRQWRKECNLETPPRLRTL